MKMKIEMSNGMRINVSESANSSLVKWFSDAASKMTERTKNHIYPAEVAYEIWLHSIKKKGDYSSGRNACVGSKKIFAS